MTSIISALAWTSGLLCALVCTPFLVSVATFCSPKGQSLWSRFFLRLIVKAFFVFVRVRGVERVDAGVPHLFMANHASFFDLFILAAYLPGTTRGIEAAEHFKWPVWGSYLRGVGMIPIDRTSAAASMRSMKLATTKIKQGYSILVLPEGTRTVTGRMREFNRLPFSIARKGGCDIVPVGLEGTFRVKAKLSWIIRPGRVQMTFGAPIPAAVVGELEIGDLVALVRQRVAELCGESVDNEGGDGQRS